VTQDTEIIFRQKKSFFSENNIIDDIPTKGSIEHSKNFPDGEVYLGSSVEERLEIVKKLKEKFNFTAGIGDRWDDNLLHLEIGCKSFILEEYNPDWSVVEKYI